MPNTDSGRLSPPVVPVPSGSFAQQPVRWDIVAVCAGLSLLILTLDIVAPLGIACGALYVTVIVYSLLADRSSLTWRTALVLTVFVTLGLVQDLRYKAPLLVALANRVVAGFVLWLTAALGVRLLRVKRQLVEHGDELQRLNTELVRIARYDALTGIANRRHFDEVLQHEFLRASRDRVPLALLMIDVDFFKMFNDEHGHLAGDGCLVRIAQAIQSSVRRPADLVARYGGEEFAVILPGTILKGAIERAEVIRSRIEALEIETAVPGKKARVTVSVGVSLIQPMQPGATAKMLIDGADRALYEGKGAGRNSVRIAA